MQESTAFYRLIYTSRARMPVDTKALLAQAQINNALRGITGGLALLDGVFIQYLEGSEAAVTDVFERIRRDPRHQDVKVLEQRAVKGRMFGDWSMAALHWTERTTQIFRSFSPGLDLDLHETDPMTAAPLFRAWAATEDWKPLLA
jgi:hypothetical protein